MSKFYIGSLFSGIGGLELGLETAIPNAVTAYQCELDAYCRSVLTHHWPDARRFEDVRRIKAEDYQGIDLLCGGYPCQDVSYVGKQAGMDGARSALWGEFARIIRALLPRFVVIENTPAIALYGRGLHEVVAELAACGYAVEWDCISAAAVGKSHHRDRLFVIGYKPDASNPQRAGLEKWARAPRKRSLATIARGYGRYAESGIQPLADGVPRKLAGLRKKQLNAIGNAVVPAVGFIVGQRINQYLEAYPNNENFNGFPGERGSGLAR